MELLLVLQPIVAALVAFTVPSNRHRPWVLPVAGTTQLALVTWALVRDPAALGTRDANAWVRLDALGGLVLAVLTLLFAIVSWYAPAYLRERAERPNRIFISCMLALVGMATLVTLAQHLGLMWVAIEAMTLATAPLLYFNHNPRSLEATWKYLVIGSVGIALALLGSFFVAYAGEIGGLRPPLLFDRIASEPALFSRPWLRAGFVLLLVGYGTKMGLAPLHTWKPDAYGETPGIVGALLAGGVTSCAFLALLRSYSIVNGAGEGAFARELLVFMGLLSMLFAAAFLVRQQDIKRMLAYSSVEHMGILALGIGLGGNATAPTLFHLVTNAITKAVLFLSVGNIHRSFGSKRLGAVQGAIQRVPASAGLLLAGFFAITGSPPFAPFVSEFGILDGAFTDGHYVAGSLYLVLLAAVFLGLSSTVLSAVQGAPGEKSTDTGIRDSFGVVAPPAFALALIVMLGVWVPEPLWKLIELAAARLTGVA